MSDRPCPTLAVFLALKEGSLSQSVQRIGIVTPACFLGPSLLPPSMVADPKVDGSARVPLEVSPRKRQKTLEISPSKVPSWKGKGKIETGEDNAEGNSLFICGICLSEDGKANRGVIDCCDHYFCFVCIMEWAKVESRCPMCKQRFVSIWRPMGPRSCLQERLVEVPVRDQARQVEAQNVDLYANARCTICKLSDNDSVLLLCDLCDSAAHTYCVGLGKTVPEGDWYCNDCMISRNEHSNPDIQCDGVVEKLSGKVELVAADQADAFICEIVKDEPNPLGGSSSQPARSDYTVSCMDKHNYLDISSSQSARGNNADSCRTSRKQNTGNLLRETSCPRKGTSRKSRQEVAAELRSVLLSARPETSDHRARTLSCCRRLHQRIKTLRENWNSFQTGSLSFSSCFDSRSAEDIERRHKAPLDVFKDSCKEVNPIRSLNVALDVKISCSKATVGRGYDVDRAWRMMAMAKTLSRGLAANSADSSKGPKSSTIKENPPARRMIYALGNETPVDINAKKCIAKNSEAKNFIVNSNFYVNKNVLGSCSNTSIGYCDPSIIHIPVAPISNVRNSDHHSNPWLSDKKLSNVRIENLDCDSQSTFISKSSNLCHTEPKAEAASVGKLVPSESVKALRDDQVKDEHAAKTYETDKHQIQSLVKLNLKLLARGKQLGVDRFKEVARIATHTVLAACGLEHSKSLVRPFFKLHCIHAIRLEATSLMSDCCTECFNFFIQDVVRTILSEKV